MRRRPRWSLPAAVLVLALAGGGCGNRGALYLPPPPPAPTPTPTPTPQNGAADTAPREAQTQDTHERSVSAS